MPIKQLTVNEFLKLLPVPDLQQASVFGALSAEAILFLLENGKLFQANQGDILFEYGDPGDSFFIICKGTVDFFKQHKGARRKTRTVKSGEELGFVPMIALHDHTGQGIVYEDSLLLEISCALFSNLHETHPSDFGIFVLNLARDMARTFRRLSNDLVNLSTSQENPEK